MALIKTYEEDADIQSILTYGDKSEVIQPIKEVDADLANDIVTAIQMVYNAAVDYRNVFIGKNYKTNTNANVNAYVASKSALQSNSLSLNITAEEALNKIVTSLDFVSTLMQHMPNNPAMVTVAGKSLGNVTGPLGLGIAALSFGVSNAMFIKDNLIPAFKGQEDLWNKIRSLRDQNFNSFDNAFKNSINVAFTVVGFVAAAGALTAGLPAIAVAGVCIIAPTAINMLYDWNNARLHNGLYEYFVSTLEDGFGGDMDSWLQSIYTGVTYSATNSDDKIFYGTPNNDYLVNYGNNVFITSGNGDDAIYNEMGDNVKINAGAGNNYVSGGDNVVVGNGNNTVLANGNVNAGSGNNIIVVENSTQDHTEVHTGGGDNYIECNGVSNLVIQTGSGNDHIQVPMWNGYVYDVVINAGEGNNVIENGATNTQIRVGAGNNTIRSNYNTNAVDNSDGKKHYYSTITAGGGNNYFERLDGSIVNTGNGDNIFADGGGNYINAGSGNDYIVSYLSEIHAGDGRNTVFGSGTINSGFDDDYIESSGLIDAGDGKNTIIGIGGGTIKTGTGDDLIQGGWFIDAGNGKNTVIGGKTIKFGAENDFVSFYSGSSFVDAGNGNNTIRGSSKNTVIAGVGKDIIYAGSSSSINAGDGNNYVHISGDGTIKTGSGNDTVISSGNALVNVVGGKNVISVSGRGSVAAGGVNDTIISGNRSSINAGGGANYVSLGGDYHIITAGAGNDTIFAGIQSSINAG